MSKPFKVDAIEEALKQFQDLAEKTKESQPEYDDIVTYVRSVQMRVDNIARNFLLTHWEDRKRSARGRNIVLTLLLICAFAFTVQAQEKHRWYRDGKGFWLALALNSAASSFDMESTQYCIHSVIGCTEKDPLVGNGRVREYGVNLAADGAIAFFSHRRRDDRDKKWWMPQLAPIGSHVGLGIRNLRAHNVCTQQAVNIEVCSGVE